jgi:hypothetical protein
MKNRNKAWLIACELLGVAAFLVSSGAAQATSFTSPYGSSAVVAIAGMESGSAILYWRRKSDSHCTTSSIGNSSGLNGNHIVIGSDADSGGYYDDEMVAVNGTTTVYVPCSNLGDHYVTALNYNGYTLDISGDAGNDFISGSTSTNINGGPGDDWIVSFKTSAAIEADDNDVSTDGIDAVLTISAGTSETVYTYAEGDCVYDDTKTYTLIDCGAGTDIRRTGMNGTTSCNVTSSSCTGLH